MGGSVPKSTLSQTDAGFASSRMSSGWVRRLGMTLRRQGEWEGNWRGEWEGNWRGRKRRIGGGGRGGSVLYSTL